MGKKKLELDMGKIIYRRGESVYLETTKWHGDGFSFERMIDPGEQQHTRF